ncbi:hypothetical protein CDL15_Pgr020128 [Punica granatum]|uniref:Uncharacterized protein n=1 Tax=Punica granatum TaxID=22663 RepID=A0A218VQM6_PUNGR|nr:hypothetical protein CDL15_Pgr020128 [Punica granatum]
MATQISKTSFILKAIVLFALIQCAISRYHDPQSKMPSTANDVKKILEPQCLKDHPYTDWCCESVLSLGCFKDRKTSMKNCPPYLASN